MHVRKSVEIAPPMLLEGALSMVPVFGPKACNVRSRPPLSEWMKLPRLTGKI